MADVKKEGNSSNEYTNPVIMPYSFRIYVFEYPNLVITIVNIIGSKKYEKEPINLLPVDGMEIFNISFKIFLSNLKLFKLIFLLGINNMRQMLEQSSLNIFIRTTPVVANVIPYINSFGIKNMINNNLIVCSIILDITYGNIFSLPKKYPLKMLERHINGRVKLIAMIG